MAAQRTPQEVVTLIQAFIDGSDERAWDDFESVPIADQFLESIRQRAIPMGPPDPDLAGIVGLLSELRSRYPNAR